MPALGPWYWPVCPMCHLPGCSASLSITRTCPTWAGWQGRGCWGGHGVFRWFATCLRRSKITLRVFRPPAVLPRALSMSIHIEKNRWEWVEILFTLLDFFFLLYDLYLKCYSFILFNFCNAILIFSFVTQYFTNWFMCASCTWGKMFLFLQHW